MVSGDSRVWPARSGRALYHRDRWQPTAQGLWLKLVLVFEKYHLAPIINRSESDQSPGIYSRWCFFVRLWWFWNRKTCPDWFTHRQAIESKWVAWRNRNRLAQRSGWRSAFGVFDEANSEQHFPNRALQLHNTLLQRAVPHNFQFLVELTFELKVLPSKLLYRVKI